MEPVAVLPSDSLVVAPGPNPATCRDANGHLLTPPDGWELLPPGDAALTRRVKAAGPSWTVQEKVGRRVFSRGVWAPADVIAAVRTTLADERASPAYDRKQKAARERRDRRQGEYVESFQQAVVAYLAFAPTHAELAERLATAVAKHATPIGSGTVARTQRIPIERRAEAAVVAWLRHQTTAYDSMTIRRVKGERRAVRRQLAQASKLLLSVYREGRPVPANCPLQQALSGP
jgi:hypothetical protein